MHSVKNIRLTNISVNKIMRFYYNNSISVCGNYSFMDTDYIEWVRQGLKQKGKTQVGLAAALGIAQPQITRLLQGIRRLKTDEIPKIAEYLESPPPTTRLAPIVGRVGANAECVISYGEGDPPNDFAPLPPGGNGNAVAVEVYGDSMGLYAPDGSLVYFEDKQDAPTEDMLGEMVVAGLADGRVLLKRMRRGSQPGLYDLESVSGSTISDADVVWAAHVTAIIPPRQARKIIKRGG